MEIVHPNTPASAAGLRVGDVILQIEDVGVRDENHLINTVCTAAARSEGASDRLAGSENASARSDGGRVHRTEDARE